MQQTSNIIELLKETAFPHMLLIDGSWGSGKTHYIKNELENALSSEFQKHKISYFSLYGVSSIDDFRDRLISLTLTDNTQTSDVVNRATQLFDSIATNVGARGIGGILNGVAGAYKYKLYSDLDNSILLLDDLERISNEKTIKDILGECLNLVESKNIKVVVIANEAKLTCKDDVEKVFVDKIKFSYSSEQIADILSEEFNGDLSEPLINELILNINSIGSSNIRVLKRALIKFKKLKEKISIIPNISLEFALSNILIQIIKVCYAKFEAGHSTEEIKKSIQTYMKRTIKDKQSNLSNYSSEKEQELDRILGGDIRHEYLVDFCCEGVFRFENIASELSLPLEGRLLDKILNENLFHQLSEKEFIKGTELLTALIDKTSNLHINEWFKACDTFIYFIENKYLTSEVTRQSIINICKNVKTESFNHSKVPEEGAWGGFYNNDIQELYNKKLSLVRESIKLSENTSFSSKFYLSWTSLENEVHPKLVHTPFLQNIGVEKTVKAINDWTSSDIYSFSNYLRIKYSFENIEDFLEPEHETIKGVIHGLDQLSLKPSLKLGAILGLKEILSDINTRMTNKLTSKAQQSS